MLLVAMQLLSLLCLLFSRSCHCGVLEQREEISLYESAMAPGGQVEQDMTVIQDAAYKYTSRNKLKEQEGIKGDITDQGSIAEYVRRLCQGDNVQWGAVSIGKARDAPNLKGYTDFTYKVEHSDKKDAVGRGNIANLFWLLERGSSKLKVTKIQIDAIGKAKPHEIPEDSWNVGFEVTVRVPDESGRRR